MASMSLTKKTTAIHATVLGTPFNPNNLGPVAANALARLQAQFPAAGVATVRCSLVDRVGIKFEIESAQVIPADQAKAAL